MPASTARLVSSILCALLFWGASPASAAPKLAVQGSGSDARLEVAGAGLAEILANELSRGGWYAVKASGVSTSELPSEANEEIYFLRLTALAFGETCRGRESGVAADLLRLAGKGNRVAQVEFRLEAVDSAGTVLWDSVYEGIESRHGQALASDNVAYLSGLNFLSDTFRLSKLGRAGYKAIGDALSDIYAALPQKGRVLALAGDSLVVDLGSAGQVQKGDRLAVFHDLGISNSEGRLVWPHLVRCGTAEVVELRPQSCLCLVLDGVLEMAEGDSVLPLVQREQYPAESLPDS